MRREDLRLLGTQLRYDLQQKYLGSIAGVYWALLNPAMQIGMYLALVTLVFRARVGAAGDGRAGYAVFLLCGLGPWLALQEGVVSATTSVVRHGGLVKNLVFPRGLLPLSGALTSCVSLGSSLVVALFISGTLGPGPGWSWAALALLVPLQLALTVGAGLLLAPIHTFLRDTGQLLPVFMQVVMLATPVVYALEDVPSAARPLCAWNPLFHLIDGYRRALHAGVGPDWGGLAYLAAWTAAVLLLGRALFRRTEGYFEAVV